MMPADHRHIRLDSRQRRRGSEDRRGEEHNALLAHVEVRRRAEREIPRRRRRAEEATRKRRLQGVAKRQKIHGSRLRKTSLHVAFRLKSLV